MFYFHPWFGMLTIAGALISIFLAFINDRLTAARLAGANREQSALITITEKSLRNAEVVRPWGCCLT